MADLSHIDAFTPEQVSQALFDAVTSMLPASAELFSYKTQQWHQITNLVEFHKVFPKTYFKGALPRIIHCRGISTCKCDNGQFSAVLTGHPFPEELTGQSTDEQFAYAKVWLKAFERGYVVKNHFYVLNECRYPSKIDYFDAYYSQSLPSNLKAETADPLLLIKAGKFGPQSVTNTKPSPETVTPANPVQSLQQSVTSVPTETVTSYSPSTEPVTLCPCGCGVTLIGRQKSATPACRKRLSRAKAAA